jgi:hypothetical protein
MAIPASNWQKAKGLQYPADVVGQSGSHTHELRPCTGKGSRSMAVERLDVNGPVPASADDLSQSLRAVLICLVDLHLKGGSCMPGIETYDFEPKIAEFMHQPWRHRSGLDSYADVISRMPQHHIADLFRDRGTLAPP